MTWTRQPSQWNLCGRTPSHLSCFPAARDQAIREPERSPAEVERGRDGDRPSPTAPMSHSRRALLLFAVVALSSCSKQPVGPMQNIWRPLPGHVESLVVPAFRNGRQCWVYLPPGYSTSTRRYPDLYVHDGQWTFDQKAGMHVNRICEDLIRRGEMEPIIVVAIEEAGQRTFDYTPWQDSDAPTGGGDTYVRAVRDTLKPAID